MVNISPRTPQPPLTCCQEVLQDPRCLASVAVPDDVDRAVLSPVWEGSFVGLAVASVSMKARVLLAVAHSTALELVKNLASPARCSMRGRKKVRRYFVTAGVDAL